MRGGQGWPPPSPQWLWCPRPLPCGLVVERTKMFARWIFSAWTFRIYCILQCFDVPPPPCGVVVEETKMLVRWIFSAWMFRMYCILQCFDVPPPPLWCGSGRNQDACAMDLQCVDVLESIVFYNALKQWLACDTHPGVMLICT